MEAKELRIGNLVECDGNILEVIRISKDVINYETVIKSKGLQTNSGRKVPIPITEEWLLKFGFIKDMAWTYSIELINNNRLVYYLGEKGWSIGHKNYSDFTNLIYIHEVQNLYFAITGTELKLKND